MDYPQTLEFLFSQLPMYQRVGAAAYKTNLDNTIALCRKLKDPQNSFPSIHIAGTNGKGSVAHMISSVLQEAGYRTGLYTSPHLKDFRERIRIDGEMISEEYVINFVNNARDLLDEIQPSFFEYTFGMAMKYFEDQDVDIAVVETGMGGRLDSTNIITPLVSVITNIGMDHTRFLGDTLRKIAAEKAGIIKTDVPVVIGETQDEIVDLFLAVVESKKTTVYFADQMYKIKDVIRQVRLSGLELILENTLDMRDRKIQLPFQSFYQVNNCLTALSAIDKLRETGLKIETDAVKAGILHVHENTGFQGRWQKLQEDPLVICDTGHNQDGINKVVAQIDKEKYTKLHFVFGTVDDKNVEDILELLPKKAQYYFCKANIPRGLDQDILKNQAEKYELSGNSFNSVILAYEAALEQAGQDDMIFVGGSTFVVAEVL